MHSELQSIITTPFLARITDKICEARLRCYGHVQQQDSDHCIKCILEAEVYWSRSWGRQRKRWINTISQDLITLNLTPVDAEDWDERWRRVYLGVSELITTLCALLKYKDVLISPRHYLASVVQRLRLQCFTWIWCYINFITYLLKNKSRVNRPTYHG